VLERVHVRLDLALEETLDAVEDQPVLVGICCGHLVTTKAKHSRESTVFRTVVSSWCADVAAYAYNAGKSEILPGRLTRNERSKIKAW
jgi:hypothetical protein